jgi:hypothetical protein
VSIYELHTLINGLGGLDETRRALDSLREKTVRAGFPGLHLNVVEWGVRNLPDKSIEGQNRLLKELTTDSLTDYVWVHHLE